LKSYVCSFLLLILFITITSIFLLKAILNQKALLLFFVAIISSVLITSE
jgi:uncharacterized membrane protein YraQ (UPF0718 family)